MSKVRDLNKFKSSKQPASPTAPKARKRATEPFVIVPLGWIECAARCLRSPVTLVLMELLYASWKAKGAAFPLPSARLKQLGVDRKTKQRVLRYLESAQLIAVQRAPRQTPLITLNRDS